MGEKKENSYSECFRNFLKDETYTGFEKFVMLWKYMMFYDTPDKKNLLEENYTDITKLMQKEK